MSTSTTTAALYYYNSVQMLGDSFLLHLFGTPLKAWFLRGLKRNIPIGQLVFYPN